MQHVSRTVLTNQYKVRSIRPGSRSACLIPHAHERWQLAAASVVGVAVIVWRQRPVATSCQPCIYAGTAGRIWVDSTRRKTTAKTDMIRPNALGSAIVCSGILERIQGSRTTANRVVGDTMHLGAGLLGHVAQSVQGWPLQRPQSPGGPSFRPLQDFWQRSGGLLRMESVAEQCGRDAPHTETGPSDWASA